MKIIVLNLSRSTTQEELTALFEKHGKVISSSLVIDPKTGKSKGFGFVEMKDATEAKSAIAKLHGITLANNRIRVKAADQNK